MSGTKTIHHACCLQLVDAWHTNKLLAAVTSCYEKKEAGLLQRFITVYAVMHTTWAACHLRRASRLASTTNEDDIL